MSYSRVCVFEDEELFNCLMGDLLDKAIEEAEAEDKKYLPMHLRIFKALYIGHDIKEKKNGGN